MNETYKASKLETLGAWLGVWTPPRDVVVPPIPWRKVAMVAAGLLLVAAAVAAFVAPAIDDAKDESSAQERRELEQRAAQRRARLRQIQKPRTGALPAAATRDDAVGAVATAIGDDARKRFSPGSQTATCEPAPGTNADGGRFAYDCLSATSAIEGAADQAGAKGRLGYPYRAIIDLDAKRYAFCRINPLPGEQAVVDPRNRVQLEAPCKL